VEEFLPDMLKVNHGHIVTVGNPSGEWVKHRGSQKCGASCISSEISRQAEKIAGNFWGSLRK